MWGRTTFPEIPKLGLGYENVSLNLQKQAVSFLNEQLFNKAGLVNRSCNVWQGRL